MSRRCMECGIGAIRPLAKEGRIMNDVTIPATLKIPTCDHCGSEWIDPATARELDDALYAQASMDYIERCDAAGILPWSERPFDPAERAREKQASRDEDERRLASGEITTEQLRQENGAFAFPPERVRILSKKDPT